MRREEVAARAGRGITVAVIDSGINAGHPHVGEVAGGVAFLPGEGGIVESEEWEDRIGHGTAVAGVLRATAPAAALHAVRVFPERLVTTPQAIAAALRWCAREEVDIANLSLGSRDPRSEEVIDEACREALDAGVVVVAAAHADPGLQYPAAFPGVLGVAPDEECGWDELVHRPHHEIPFFAHGYPRSMPGAGVRDNFRGASFAAPHLTAWVARLLEWDPALGGESLRRALIGIAKRAGGS
ncbi:MAG: S8 family serine peptidase, partial [Planctomycetota bacterium]